MISEKKRFYIFIIFLLVLCSITFYLGTLVSKNREIATHQKLNEKLERLQSERDSLMLEYNLDIKEFNSSIKKLREEVAKNNKLKEEYLKKANEKPPEAYNEVKFAIYDLLNKIRN